MTGEGSAPEDTHTPSWGTPEDEHTPSWGTAESGPSWGTPADEHTPSWGTAESGPSWGTAESGPSWGTAESDPSWETAESGPSWGTPSKEPVPQAETPEADRIPAWGTPEAQQVPPWGTPSTQSAGAPKSLLKSKGAWAWAAAVAGTVVLLALGTTGGRTYDQLEVGECARTSADGTLAADVPVVACSHTHEVEVVGVFDEPSGPWPGDGDAADEAVYDKCLPLFASYVGSAATADQSMTWYSPTQDDWSSGVRRVVCVDTTPSGSSTSARHTAAPK